MKHPIYYALMLTSNGTSKQGRPSPGRKKRIKGVLRDNDSQPFNKAGIISRVTLGVYVSIPMSLGSKNCFQMMSSMKSEKSIRVIVVESTDWCFWCPGNKFHKQRL